MKHLPLGFWARFNGDVARARPGTMLVGELLDGDPSKVARTWREGGFTAMFDFPLAFALGDVFCRGQSPVKLAAALTNDRRYPDPSQLVTLVDNHDLPRLSSLCAGDLSRVRDALAFLLTARGVPSLAWGTEVGLAGEKEPENRPSMRFEANALTRDVSEWLALRRASPALRDGAPVVLALEEGRLAVGRATADQLAVVIVNRRQEPWTPELPAPWSAASWTWAGPNSPSPGAARRPLPAAQGEATAVFVSDARPGAWAQLARDADAQWRTGRVTRVVELSAPGAPDAWAVGSGPELGDWNPEKSVRLPARLELPVGGVFELKLIRRPPTGVTWEPGENRVLQVAGGQEPMVVRLK